MSHENSSNNGNCNIGGDGVTSAYCELLQLLHDKPIQQVKQEYGQISDVLKGRNRQDDDDADEWLLRTGRDMTSSTEVDGSHKTNDTYHNNTLQNRELILQNVMMLPQNQENRSRIYSGIDDVAAAVAVTAENNSDRNHNASRSIRWIPVRPDSSVLSSPTQSWTFYLEYMPSLQYMQITLRPQTKTTQNGINVVLNIDHIQVSLDVPKYHKKQEHEAGPTILLFEYIDSDITTGKGNKKNGLSSKLQLQLPASLLLDNTPPLFPQYTTSLVESDTAVAIRLQCKHQGNDTYDHSIRDLPSCLEPLDDSNDDSAGIHESISQSAPYRQPKDLCLGCRNCQIPIIPLLLPSSSLNRDEMSRSTKLSECENIDGKLNVLLDSTILPIRHIVPLPTGHLNDLHDYLICYNDGPTNVNFNAYNNDDNDERYDIPPTGVMFENDIIYAASEANVYTMNICTLSIPSYGNTSSNDNKTIPRDIEYQSQLWQCHTLPPITKCIDTIGNAPLTVTCSICASTIGYKVVSETMGGMENTTGTSNPIGISVGYHLLKHRMILLHNKGSSIPPPIQTQLAICNAEQQSTEWIIPLAYKQMLSHSISQFIIYEMVRIAESKGIFTFVIGKHLTDVHNERQNDSDKVYMANRTTRTAVIKLRLLNWKTIAASWKDSCVTTAKSKGSTDSVTPALVDVWVPVWQRRAKVYYETIMMDEGVCKESNTTPKEQSVPSDTSRSFRNQFMVQHNAWCCQGDLMSTRNKNTNDSGLFLKGFVPTDIEKATFNDENIDEITDPTIIRLYLSMDEFDLLFKQLQDSSKFYSKEVAQAIRSSVTTMDNTSYNSKSIIGLASIAL